MSFQTPRSIEEMLTAIHKREYLMPAIQREFVWGADQITKLVDSLMRGYPVGSFLLWAVLDFRSARQRDRAAGTVYPPGQPARTALVVVLGLALWAVFAFGAHQWLFGVRPFGR